MTDAEKAAAKLRLNNVDMSVEGDVLTITVNLADEQGPSTTGKSIIIATTSGAADVPGHDGMKLGLNVYRKA